MIGWCGVCIDCVIARSNLFYGGRAEPRDYTIWWRVAYMHNGVLYIIAADGKGQVSPRRAWSSVWGETTTVIRESNKSSVLNSRNSHSQELCVSAYGSLCEERTCVVAGFLTSSNIILNSDIYIFGQWGIGISVGHLYRSGSIHLLLTTPILNYTHKMKPFLLSVTTCDESKLKFSLPSQIFDIIDNSTFSSIVLMMAINL